MNDDEMRDLETKSRAAFDASVESQDGATRSRLAQSRSRALEELHRRRHAGSSAWIPAGAAAAALVAALLWQREQGGVPEMPTTADVSFEDFEIVAGGEDLDMLSEDEDFVAWAAEEFADGVG